MEAVRAADRVLVTAEEVVEPSVIKSDPSRTRITREQVDAVVEVPFGAHPSPVAGRYDRDNEFYVEYAAATRGGGFAEWARRVDPRGRGPRGLPRADRPRPLGVRPDDRGGGAVWEVRARESAAVATVAATATASTSPES